MKNKTLSAAILLLSVAEANAGEDPNKSKTEKDYLLIENVHGSVTFATDNIFRGLTLSKHKPLVKAALFYEHDISPSMALYLGLTGLNNSASSGGLELVPIVGIKGEKNNWLYDVSVRYEYVTSWTTPKEPGAGELLAMGGYNFKIAKVTAGLGYSPNWYLDQGTGWFPNARVEVPLPQRFTFDVGIGYQTTRKGHTALWVRDYAVWDVGLSRDFKAFTLGVRYTDTNLTKKDAHNTTTFSSTIVGSITAKF